MGKSKRKRLATWMAPIAVESSTIANQLIALVSRARRLGAPDAVIVMLSAASQSALDASAEALVLVPGKTECDA